ncbi:MAG: hypothetical protein PQJ59_10390 [Spirochaetales bacterium]|nr:hypothetical protein [Spirochaetales bacterium]
MRNVYVNGISQLLGEVLAVDERLEEEYKGTESLNYYSYHAHLFSHSGPILDQSRKDFRENLSSFFTYLYDQDLETLDEIIQELLMTLNKLDQDTMVNYLQHLPDNQIIRGSNYGKDEHILHFKNAIKNEAIRVLKENRSELDRKEREYQNSLGVGGDESLLDQFNKTLIQFRELEGEIGNNESKQAALRTAILNNAMVTMEYGGWGYDHEYGDQKRMEIEAVQENIDLLKQTQANLMSEKPELAAIGKRFDDLGDHSAVLAELSRGFAKAREAIKDVYNKVVDDDIPLVALGPIIRTVQAQLEILPLGEEGNDLYSLHVNEWIQSQNNRDRNINLIIAGVSVGLGIVAGILTFGVGGAAAAAVGFGLGATGSAVGVAGAVYNFERAEDLNSAADSQAMSNDGLLDDPEAAKKAYAWAIADLILSGVDVVFAGLDMAKLMGAVNKFDNAVVGRKVIFQLSDLSDETVEAAARIYKGLDETTALKLDSTLRTGFDKYNEGLIFAEKLKVEGINNLVKIENADDIKTVVNFFPGDENTTIRLLNSIKDPQGLLNPQVVLDKYDLTSGRTLEELNSVLRQWGNQTARSTEEIAVLLKYRPDAPKVVARVQTRNYPTLGRESAFTWVTDPEELIGLDFDGLADRIGLTEEYKEWIRTENNGSIWVDFIESPVEHQKVSWDYLNSETKTLIEVDDSFAIRLEQISMLTNSDGSLSMSKLDDAFAVLSNTNVEDVENLSSDMKLLRETLEGKFGNNPLFTGKGYTVDPAGNFGTREWGLVKPDVGLEIDEMKAEGYNIIRIEVTSDGQAYPLLLDHNLMY